MTIRSLSTASCAATAERPPAHPNVFVLRRIAEALGRRTRYLYVEPQVVPDGDGYRVESACCSRNLDPTGGVVDIALLRWSQAAQEWTLSWKDQRAGAWRVDFVAARLDQLLDRLANDTNRRFWQ